MITLTPNRVASAYEFLRAFPQFKSLPHSDEVEFHVVRTRKKFADFGYDGHAIIRVSENTNGSVDTLLRSVAHEQVHFSLYLKSVKTWDSHGEEFRKLARSVCKTFGWDEKAF